MTEPLRHARVLWEYLRLGEEPRPMDAVFAFGSESTRVAERAADLFLGGYGRYLIVSGGTGTGVFGTTEGDAFAAIARSRGVPEERILVEREASNTGENIAFVRRLVRERGLPLASFLLVHKPYLERRTAAAFRKQWPEAAYAVTSPQVPFERYATGREPVERLIRYLTAALYRIKAYPALGFQVPQEVPEPVAAAYESLRKLGYADKPLPPDA